MEITLSIPQGPDWASGQARINSLGEDEVGELVYDLCQGSQLDGDRLRELIISGPPDQAFKLFAGTISSLQFALEKLAEDLPLGAKDQRFSYVPAGAGWVDDESARVFALYKAGVLQAAGFSVALAN